MVLLLLALVVMTWLALPGTRLLATPTMPELLVNHATKQCVVVIRGDDCHWCNPPAGWEVAGVAEMTQCPAGYALLDRIDMECTGYKNQFCCTSGSHHGDCEDLLVHEAGKQCAFVEDITRCAVPEGWSRRPAGVDPARWSCPYDYQWAGDLPCMAETATREPAPTATATVTREPTATSAEEAPPEPAGPSAPAATAAPGRTLTRLAVPVAVGALLGVLVWLVRRRAGDGRR